MKAFRKMFVGAMSLLMVFTLLHFPVNVYAEKSEAAYIQEVISYYKNYQDAALTDIQRVLEEFKAVNAESAASWTKIMNFWSKVNRSGYVNEYTDEQLDTGIEVSSEIPQDDSVAVVILGYALNSDGTMKDELVGRLKTGKAIADKLPNAYVVVTGGVEKNGWTEAARMSDWLIAQGMDEDRIIREDKAGDTVGNAKNTYAILVEEYPQVDKVIIVTGDYHVPRGSILYYAKFVLEAAANDSKEIEIISNGGYETGSNGYETYSLQASGVCSVAGVSSSLPSVDLSVLEKLTVSQKEPYVAGNELKLQVIAGYNTDYQRDVSDLAIVTGFDSTKDETQTIGISYTENGETLSGEYTLTEDAKVFSAYQKKIEQLLDEISEMSPVTYSAATYAVLEYAEETAEDALSRNASEAELESVYNALILAVDGLKTRENVALNKTVTASHNQAEAAKITNGVKTDYWSGYEGGNVPIEDSSFVIDLNGIYTVEAVNVMPYYQANNRYYHYDVYVSSDKANWTKIAEQRDTALCTSDGATFVLDTPLNARYIKVQGVDVLVNGRPDINNFHINEVQVYGNLFEEIEETTESLENLALSGLVTLNEGGTNAYPLNDGAIANSYSNSNAAITDSFATVKLPKMSTVHKVKVVTYYNNLTKWYNWEVMLSTDGVEWTSAGKYETESNPGTAGYTIELNTPVQARYVKVQGLATNNNNLHLVEIEVYGDTENAALNKPVTTSNNHSSGVNLTDGVASNNSYWNAGDYTWSDPNGARPSAVVDLQGVHALETISVMGYISSSRYYQFEVYTSLDGSEYTLFDSKTDDVKANYSTNFMKDVPVNARYIKVVGTLNSANSGFHLSELRAYGEKLPEANADYTAVINAKSAVPADLSVYYADTVVQLKLALCNVVEGLKASRQNEVDAYASAISTAVANLKLLPADYSAVAEAKKLVPSDLSLYTDDSVAVLQNALSSVVEGKSIKEQETVDGYAAAIENAVSALTYKPADYAEVNELLNSLPSDMSVYTDETAAVLNEAKANVNFELNITQQRIVDGYAEAIREAMEGLEFKRVTDEDVQSYLKSDEITEVPETLQSLYADVAALKSTLIEKVSVKNQGTEEQMAFYNVELMVSFDDGLTFVKADENHWPQDGKILVKLAYPEGTDKSYSFTVVHMFTSAAFNKTPGEVEYPQVEKTSEGIEFYVTGLSPIAVGWKKPVSILPEIFNPETAVNTGDSSSVTGWAAVSMASLLGLLLLMKSKFAKQR